MAASWSDTQVLNQLNSGYTWAGSTITYSFPSSASGMESYDGAEYAGFRAANALTQSQMRIAIQTWDDLIAPTFSPGTPGTSDLEIAFTSTGIGYAHAYFPETGSVWFNSAYTSGNNDLDGAPLGTHGFSTYIHELGHALGLNHMGNYNGAGAWSPSSYQDSTVLSVMSYFGPTAPNHSNEIAQADWIDAAGNPSAPQTPMLNDIMAIQAMYGASTTTRTGDTTYGFNSNVTGAVAPIYDFTQNFAPILTIWDSGGNDTLDLSGWSGNSIITLVQGGFSSGNSMTNNICIAWNTVIENAVGGAGSDAITGNSANNRLEGNGGNDNISGGAGNDTLAGGAGSDVLDGGTGTDTAVFGGSYSSYTITYSAVTATYVVASGATGSDTVTNVEFFQFADQVRSAAELLSNDTGAPTLQGASPADNASNVAPGANIVLTFSETVQAGSGDIVIHNANGSVFRTIAVTDTSQVSISGSTVTINPSVNLAAGGSYYVMMAAGVIKDQAGNAFAGIASSSTLNFSTAASVDTAAPTLTGTTPADNATGVAVGANLTLTFSETIQAGTGSIQIHNANGTVARTISVNDASQVSLSGNTLVINPAGDLAYASGYYVTMGAGVVVDAAGNAFAGIASSSAFNFTTAASSIVDDLPRTVLTTGQVLTNGTPSTGVINFIDDGDWFRITLQAGVEYTFDMVSTGLPDPLLALLDASGTLILGDDDGGEGLNSRFSYTPTASGTYYLEAWDAGSGTGGYRITVSGGGGMDDYPWSTATTGVVGVNGGATGGTINFVDDLDLLAVTLVAGQRYIFDMRSTGLADPYLILYDPDLDLIAEDDDGGSAGYDSRIEFTATASGTYYLGAMDYGSGTGTYTLTAVADTDDYPYDTGTAGVVTVGGNALTGRVDYAGDEDLVRINFTAGVTYIIELERTSGGLADPYLRLYEPDLDLAAYDDDSAGNLNSRITFTAPSSGTYYIAISDYDDGTGGYTVEADVLDVAAPVLQSTTPADNAGNVAVGADLTFTFNEAVRAGSGNILVHNASGTVARSIPVTDASQVSFSGSTMTVNPASDLSFSSGYYVTFAAGVVRDTAGNAHAGIASTTAFNFTTAAPAKADDFPLSTATTGVVTVNGAARTGEIDYTYDGDLFKVTLVAGTSYRFDLARTDSGGLADPYLQLFGPDLDLEAFDDDGAGGLNARIVYTATASGTYYLGAYDYDAGLGKYTLSAASSSVVDGTEGPDTLTGTSAAETLRGLGGADRLRGNGGNDQLDGGEGIDTAVFSGSRAAYEVTPGSGTMTVHALSGSDGTDTLADVERLEFADGLWAFDFEGNAGTVARTLGAVFGPAAVGYEAYAGIGLQLADGGMDAATLMQLALDVALGAGASPAAVVNLLYTNVVGVAPDAGTRDAYVSLLTSGTFTPGTLGVMASTTPFNDARIDIVGLAETGLAYI